MHFAMKDSGSDYHARLEQQLRRTADAARLSPSPALRRRTLAALHESQFAEAPPRRIHPGWAILACSLLMVVIGLFAMMQRNGAPPAPKVVNVPPSHAPLNPPFDFSAVTVQLDMSAPYKREAQLIARDAGRAWDAFRQQFPRLPRLEAPAPTPSKDDAISAPGA